jgi:hypothetical protein
VFGCGDEPDQEQAVSFSKEEIHKIYVTVECVKDGKSYYISVHADLIRHGDALLAAWEWDGRKYPIMTPLDPTLIEPPFSDGGEHQAYAYRLPIKDPRIMH